MATQYSLNVNSLFLPNLLPKPNSQTSTNPYNLSFSGGHLDAYSLMTDRLKNLFNDRFKSLYKFLDNTESLNPSKGFTSLTKLTKTPQKKSSFKDLLLKGVNFIKNNAGKGAKGLGIGLSVASQFLGDDEEIKNKNEAVSRELGSTVANAAPTLGPYGWLYKGLYDISSKTGGLLSGSNTKEFLDNGSFLADAGNTVLGAIPGLGWAFSKSPEYLDNPLVRSSMYYSNVGQFGLLHGGKKFAFNRGEINEQLKKDNLNTEVTAEHIIKPGKLAYMFDPDSIALGIKTDLEGGPTFELRGKHGMVLLFSKRSLSKKKALKKLYDGGEIIKEQAIDKLSRPSLESFLEEKRQLWTEKAIHKAATRNAPYMFKNKDWKNCIATAFDSYGLYDKNGMPLVIRNADFAADPNRYGFTELPFGDDIDHLPDGVLIQDYNNPKNRNIPGHAIILTGRDENGVPIYSWSSGNNEIEDMHPLARLYSFYWTDKVKPKAYQFIGTPEQIKLWVDEYKQIYNLSDNDIEAFKEGGKVNVIPSGALHAHKNNLTEKAEDGEKFEDVTTKGIPVVVEDEKGNLIQQAEVEREEIIFRLEVTKKLEELSKKHTDEAAIEAGKLLVKEILYNTEDNTGEML